MANIALLLVAAVMVSVAVVRASVPAEQTPSKHGRRRVSVNLDGNRRKCFLEEMTAGTVLMSTIVILISYHS